MIDRLQVQFNCKDRKENFNGLKALAKEVVDQGDLSSVMPYCANYSGTPLYRLPTSNEEIRSELKMVREEIRKFEG